VASSEDRVMGKVSVSWAQSLVAALVVLGAANHVAARAPDTFEELHAKPTVIASPQWYALELKVGPYRPAGENSAFKDTFGGDRGWLFALELDFTLWHIPYLGTLNLGTGIGRAHYTAKAFNQAGGRAGEKTSFNLIPMSALGVLRIDTLARHLGVPLTFAGKIGYDLVRWKAETGGKTDESGLNRGLRWGGQVAFELDFFEQDAARTLDEEYGVNHTFLLFEYFESKTKGTGDRSFSFGLGAEF